MKKILSASLILLLFVPTFAQAPDTLWTRIYNGGVYSVGRSVCQTTDGGYIIAGLTVLTGVGHIVYLIKTDEDGDTLWTRTFGGGGTDEAMAVQQTIDGGYIIVGYTNTIGSGNYDILLIKTDGFGNELWTKTFGGAYDDYGASVQQTVDSGYVIIGSAKFGPQGYQEAWLIKTDENGNAIWNKRFGGVSDAGGSDVQKTNDGGYIVLGISPSVDFWLIKTDGNGDTVWTRTFGGSDMELGSEVQQTADEGYIITGQTDSFGAGSSDLWLVKTDENGDTLWTKTFGGTSSERGNSVKQLSDGSYIIVGNNWSFGNGSSDLWYLKVDESGNELWNKIFGSSDNDGGTSMQLTQDGGYIITGYLSENVWLLKTEPDIVGVKSETNEIPSEFLLSQNYPNPFNPSTRISWQSPAGGVQTLKIYDVLGNEVATLANEYKPAGAYEIEWDASEFPSGVYFYQLKTENYFETKKMILTK